MTLSELTPTRAAHIPQWFVAVFAIVYVSGYLIDFYYASALGISENGGDLLKLKYIQIGINFIIFLLILAGPPLYQILQFVGLGVDEVFRHCRVPVTRAYTIKEARVRIVRFHISLFTIIYSLSIYSSFVFTPWHYFRQDSSRLHVIIGLIFGVQLFYIFVANTLDRRQSAIKQTAEERKLDSVTDWSVSKLRRAFSKIEVYRILLCYGLIAATIVADYYAFGGLALTIQECIWAGSGYIFFIFCFLFGVLLYRALSRASRPPIAMPQYVAVMASSLILIFSLTLVSYAYFIFPYIPSIKGGADFTASPISTVTLKSRDSFQDKGETLAYVILVYNTGTSAYFAKPDLGNDACTWRRRDASPELIQVQQASIQKIEIAPSGADASNNCVLGGYP